MVHFNNNRSQGGGGNNINSRFTPNTLSTLHAPPVIVPLCQKLEESFFGGIKFSDAVLFSINVITQSDTIDRYSIYVGNCFR